MTKTELIDEIVLRFPELGGKIAIEGVLYSKSKNTAQITFLSDVLIGQEGFLAIKKMVRAAFPKVKVSVRVASPALGEAFLKGPNEYAAPLNDMLVRAHPAVKAWKDDIRWENVAGSVTLEMPDEFAVHFLKERGVRDLMNMAIYQVFRVQTDIAFAVRGDLQSLMDDEMRARQAEEDERLEREARLRAMQEKSAQKEQPKKPSVRPDRIKGRSIADPPMDIREITSDSGVVTIRGEVLKVETREISGGEAILLTFSVTDYTSSIRCKAFLYFRPRNPRKDDREAPPPVTVEQRAAVMDVVSQIKQGMGIMVRGNSQYDNFSHETVIMVRDMTRVEIPIRMDNAPQKRVELHMHTQMSTMDAISSVSALMERASKWGHSAIAVTDHGVVQAYPEAFSAAKKYNIKLIPGVEGYLTEDERIVQNADERPISSPIVVLDFETTGLNTQKDRIIEIGAVKLANGAVVDSFGMFVNPGCLLPAKIVELTHITDQMLRDAPDAAQALPKLLEFIGDCPIAAHNARFDCSVLSSELKRLSITHICPQIDTLTFARKLYPELKTHRLSSVCKRLGVSLKGAHRAVNDAAATAQCLALMLDEAMKRDVKVLADLNDFSQGYTLGSSSHIILLARTQKGVENINHIVSEAHLNYFRRRPHIPRAVLQKYREGIIVGSACIDGELLKAIVAGESDDKLRKLARFYDYLEIQPIMNNGFMLRDGLMESEEDLRNLNRKVVALGEALGIPVLATGDVHFLDPKDAAFRAIIQAGQGFKDCDEQPPLYLKTTEEMLEEFSYLGQEKAFEVVVKNTNAIADKVDKLFWHVDHPEGKETFSPLWPEAADDIKNMSWRTAHEMYGDVLPEIIEKRLEKELNSIIGYGYATLYSIANKLVQKSLHDGYLVGSRGSVGSSFVACMSGITEVNALPPHYRCAKCRKGYFDVPKEYTVGVDLPDKDCPVCGEPLIKEGFDIPFEVFLGFKGDKVPDIDLNFSGEYQPRAHAYIEKLFGKGSVFRAGTIGTLAEKTAFGYVLKYLEERGMTVSDVEKERLAQGCVGVKRTTGQHPGGIVVLPKGYDICQFTAIQHPADDLECGIITTHFDFNSMHDVLVKLDCLGHDDPTMMHMLEELTGINFRNIPLDDKKVMSLFSSPEALGVTQEDIGCTTGTFGVPEFGTSFVRGMLDETHPTTMEELIRISGLSHGTNVWLNNAQTLIQEGVAPLKECICTRDDIMNALINYGVESKMAFTIMESVRKGKGLRPDMEEAMRAHSVPDWFINSCKKIEYMFPKGHAVAYVTMALRVAWYKVYYPLAYYCAYFTIRGDGFDACTMLLPLPQLRQRLAEFYQLDADSKLSAKEKNEITAMELVIEMMARGYEMLPADIYKSQALRFVMEGEKSLRVSLTALGGLGESAAQGIVQARDIPFISVEDLKKRAKLSSAVIDLLREHGCLNDLCESNQVSLF